MVHTICTHNQKMKRVELPFSVGTFSAGLSLTAVHFNGAHFADLIAPK